MKFSFRGRHLDLSGRTAVCGILNVTPDSFSDGGRFTDPGRAAEHALRMEEEGADLIDIGAESTRPGAEPVPAPEEINRLLPVLGRLKRRLRVPLSVDTSKPETARAVLDAGADIINDVTGLRENNGVAGLIARHKAGVILMHMLGTPLTMQKNPAYSDVVAEVKGFLEAQARKAEAAGIPPENIAVDPGIGFGKTPGHNIALINSLGELASAGRPVFIGVSRKSLIGHILGLPVEERLEGTAALSACCILKGAAIIRVHEVRHMKRTAMTVDALKFAGGRM